MQVTVTRSLTHKDTWGGDPPRGKETHMQVALCRHIKSDGHQCKAVALKTSVFCYFHSRLNEGHRLYRSRMVGGKGLMERGHIIALPALEDRLAVQLALSEVINALACNFIDIKRAQALFYGLQLASSNCRGLDAIFNPTEVVRTCDRAPRHPRFVLRRHRTSRPHLRDPRPGTGS
jgi:hypothetical protein